MRSHIMELNVNVSTKNNGMDNHETYLKILEMNKKIIAVNGLIFNELSKPALLQQQDDDRNEYIKT